MKTHLLILATVAALAAPQSLCAQTVKVAPEIATKGIELSEVTISQDVNKGDDGSEPSADLRVIAKVTNRADRSLVQPVFELRLAPAPLGDAAQRFATAAALNPGESVIAVIGTLSLTEAQLRAAKTVTVDLIGDPFAHAGWDRQLKFRSSMTFTDTSFRFSPANHMAGVKGSFQNRSGIQIKRVQGTAIFRDAEGRLLDAGPFSYTAGQDKENEMWVGYEMPGFVKAKTCVLQVDSFEE